MADLKPLTPVQEALMREYHHARVIWATGDWGAFDSDAGIAYAAALDACLDAGFDPFHHPQPQ